MSRPVHSDVGLQRQPLHCLSVEVVKIDEPESLPEVVPDILDASLHLPLGLGPSDATEAGSESNHLGELLVVVKNAGPRSPRFCFGLIATILGYCPWIDAQFLSDLPVVKVLLPPLSNVHSGPTSNHDIGTYLVATRYWCHSTTG